MILVNPSDDLSRSGLAPVCGDCCELLSEFVSYCPLFCAGFRVDFDRLIEGGTCALRLPNRDLIRAQKLFRLDS